MKAHNIPFHISCLLGNKKGTKDLHAILNTEIKLPSAVEKWNLLFDDDPLEWNSAFAACFKTTKDTTLQWFQYRLLHRILPVGYYLKMIKVKTTDLCSLCKQGVESIVHICFECVKAQQIWNDLSNMIFNITTITVNFNLKSVLFGEKPYSCNQPVNMIILATKHYMYICSKKEQTPNFNELVHILHHKYEVEKLVAYKNFSCHKFDKHWGRWKNFFELTQL